MAKRSPSDVRPHDIDCPYCGAPPHQPCRDDGGQDITTLHEDRRLQAQALRNGEHLSYDELYQRRIEREYRQLVMKEAAPAPEPTLDEHAAVLEAAVRAKRARAAQEEAEHVAKARAWAQERLKQSREAAEWRRKVKEETKTRERALKLRRELERRRRAVTDRTRRERENAWAQVPARMAAGQEEPVIVGRMLFTKTIATNGNGGVWLRVVDTIPDLQDSPSDEYGGLS